MTEEAGSVLVKTSSDNRGACGDTVEHKVGYFAYYNNDIFDKGPVPLLMGFYGGGDSSMYLTIHFFDSEDGVCRTALASVSGQVHECRHHTNEIAWKFISQFTR